jgi:hypothetical protein
MTLRAYRSVTAGRRRGGGYPQRQPASPSAPPLGSGRGPGLHWPAGPSARRGEDAEMTPAPDLTAVRRSFVARSGAGRLAHGVGERLQVVAARGRRGVVTLVPDQLPALGRGEPHRVHLAEIIGVRLRRDRKWTDDRRGIGVDVREGGHRRLRTAVPGAAPIRPHARTVSVRARRRQRLAEDRSTCRESSVFRPRPQEVRRVSSGPDRPRPFTARLDTGPAGHHCGRWSIRPYW